VNGGDRDQLMSLRYAAGVALLAAIYALTAKLGFAVVAINSEVASAWPPAGIALAALLLFGIRFWPGIVIGTFVANVAVGFAPLGAAAMTVGNVLEAIVAARVYAYFAGSSVSLDRVRNVCGLIVAAILGAPFSASVGAAALVLQGGVQAAPPWAIWLTWLSGDLVGILLVTPLILVWAAPLPRFDRRKAVEASALAVVLVLFTVVFFQTRFSYAYAIFPVTVWAALRFGPRGAATAIFVIAVLANYYTLRGFGQFATGTPLNNLTRLQVFFCVLALTKLIVAAVNAQLEYSLADARQARHELAEEHAAYAKLQQVAHQEAIKAKWLQGVAETTAALAHEVNNPLTSLLMHVEELEVASPDEAAESVAEIRSAAVRIDSVMKRLTGVSHPRSVAYVGKGRMLDLSPQRPDKKSKAE
jgi:integral membrane sensor domain MASE1